jgi:hypothetical protein
MVEARQMRVHFRNLWRPYENIRSFGLFNVWKSPKFFGITVLNISCEFERVS